MISLQTNVNSLVAEQDLNVNDAFQSQAIDQLSSGYRINSSADDAAGLAVANQYQADTVELQQGVRNANDGLSQLQIIDGGLSNISTMLDRMKTLATESATSTFTGSRTTLNNEYQDLISEITRQADNVQLNAGGSLNTNLNVYVGGARTSEVSGTALVNINLSGTTNGVDANSLNLANTNVLSGNSGSGSFTNNNVTNLNDPNARFLSGGSGSESFAVSYVNSQGTATTQSVTLAATANGFSGLQIVTAIDDALQGTGIQAQIASSGALQFNGNGLLSVTATTSGGPTAAPVETGATMLNCANYQATGSFQNFVAGDGGPTSESYVLSVNGTNYNVNLDSSTSGHTAADNATDAVNSLNYQLQGSGVYATTDGQGNITLQSANVFSLVNTGYTAGASGGSPGSGDMGGTTPGSGQPGGTLSSGPYTGDYVFRPFFNVFSGGASEAFTVTMASDPGNPYNFTLDSSNASSTSQAATTITDALSGSGIIALYNYVFPDGEMDLISTSAQAPGGDFTFTVDSYSSGGGSPGSGSLFGTTTGAISVTAPAPGDSAISNAQGAIQAINAAVKSLGLVQGAVGAGENTLNYAIALAQSQITNFSAAESQIKDADIAAAASSLAKAQVLQQTSIAAMAQANSTPEAVLKLLQ